MIPYGRQNICDDDIQAVVDVLKSDFLTTGPLVEQFEKAICKRAGCNYGVAVSSGTAALHASMFALGIGPGDEVIVPAITFAATANCVLYQGGTPVFCDVDPDTLLIDISKIGRLITPRTKAIIAVDYAGQSCDYITLRKIADTYGLFLVSDACHSMRVSFLPDATCFSFHPVKHITTGEGGMVVTEIKSIAEKIYQFRSHGMKEGDMKVLGYNYRMTDIQSALGMSQLKKLDGWIEERRRIAQRYDAELKVKHLKTVLWHSYHLYVVKVPNRDELRKKLYEKGIGTQIHYRPVYYHSFYAGYQVNCPEAEKAYMEILSLPMFPKLEEEEQDMIIEVVNTSI